MDKSIYHVEIMTTDLDKAKKFYSELFGWKISAWKGSPDYMLFETGKQPGGGFQKVDKVNPGDGILLYIKVDNIKAHLDKARNLGGKIIKENTEIPNIGWYGIFSDLDGNIIGVFRGK